MTSLQLESVLFLYMEGAAGPHAQPTAAVEPLCCPNCFRPRVGALWWWHSAGGWIGLCEGCYLIRHVQQLIDAAGGSQCSDISVSALRQVFQILFADAALRAKLEAARSEAVSAKVAAGTASPSGPPPPSALE